MNPAFSSPRSNQNEGPYEYLYRSFLRFLLHLIKISPTYAIDVFKEIGIALKFSQFFRLLPFLNSVLKEKKKFSLSEVLFSSGFIQHMKTQIPHRIYLSLNSKYESNKQNNQNNNQSNNQNNNSQEEQTVSDEETIEDENLKLAFKEFVVFISVLARTEPESYFVQQGSSELLLNVFSVIDFQPYTIEAIKQGLVLSKKASGGDKIVKTLLIEISSLLSLAKDYNDLIDLIIQSLPTFSKELFAFLFQTGYFTQYSKFLIRFSQDNIIESGKIIGIKFFELFSAVCQCNSSYTQDLLESDAYIYLLSYLQSFEETPDDLFQHLFKFSIDSENQEIINRLMLSLWLKSAKSKSQKAFIIKELETLCEQNSSNIFECFLSQVPYFALQTARIPELISQSLNLYTKISSQLFSPKTFNDTFRAIYCGFEKRSLYQEKVLQSFLTLLQMVPPVPVSSFFHFNGRQKGARVGGGGAQKI